MNFDPDIWKLVRFMEEAPDGLKHGLWLPYHRHPSPWVDDICVKGGGGGTALRQPDQAAWQLALAIGAGSNTLKATGAMRRARRALARITALQAAAAADPTHWLHNHDLDMPF